MFHPESNVLFGWIVHLALGQESTSPTVLSRPQKCGGVTRSCICPSTGFITYTMNDGIKTHFGSATDFQHSWLSVVFSSWAKQLTDELLFNQLQEADRTKNNKKKISTYPFPLSCRLLQAWPGDPHFPGPPQLTPLTTPDRSVPHAKSLSMSVVSQL
jgi:hypothetical protein